jgi:hypothetical protein
MQILIGIDDPDTLESIGTGEVLENLMSAMRENNLGAGSFVTRHQLYGHEAIPYTSHNSAMCCGAEVENLYETVDFCRAFMDTSCAAGSDPGLCIVDLDRLRYKKRLIRFGMSAKVTVLKKREALEVADLHRQAVYLSEHGGTGGGIIGALAGCGLRLFGYDGKLKGKLEVPGDNPVMTVGELCGLFNLSGAMDREHRPIDDTDAVRICCPTKAVFWGHNAALYLARNKNGQAPWRTYSVQELKGLVD